MHRDSNPHYLNNMRVLCSSVFYRGLHCFGIKTYCLKCHHGHTEEGIRDFVTTTLKSVTMGVKKLFNYPPFFRKTRKKWFQNLFSLFFQDFQTIWPYIGNNTLGYSARLCVKVVHLSQKCKFNKKNIFFKLSPFRKKA